MKPRRYKKRRDPNFGRETITFIVKAFNPKARRKADANVEITCLSESEAMQTIGRFDPPWTCRLFRRVEYEILLIESPEELRTAEFD